jgi:hypothetical protein
VFVTFNGTPINKFRDSSIDAILVNESSRTTGQNLAFFQRNQLRLIGRCFPTEFQKGNDNVGLKGGRVRMRMVWQVFKAKVLDHDGLVIVTGTFRS